MGRAWRELGQENARMEVKDAILVPRRDRPRLSRNLGVYLRTSRKYFSDEWKAVLEPGSCS